MDRPRTVCRFLILGSASPGLLRQSSETLAGRIYYHQLNGFAADEVGLENHRQLWLRGGFPRSYLARTLSASVEWRQSFIKTFLERDLPQLGITVHSRTMNRFWHMLAHYHGQVWNASEFARSFGVADTTVRSYLDTLSAGLVVQQLLPWHANLSSAKSKRPKFTFPIQGCCTVYSMSEPLTIYSPTPRWGLPGRALFCNRLYASTGLMGTSVFSGPPTQGLNWICSL